MSALYTVTSVNENSATVVPDLEGACEACKGKCESCTAGAITVLNTRHFPLKPGDKVSIGMTSRREIIRGFFSLLFPVGCATAGYFIPQLFNTAPQEGARAVFVLLFLAAGAAVVFAVSRLIPVKEQLSITRLR